jgi:hypothetical protein
MLKKSCICFEPKKKRWRIMSDKFALLLLLCGIVAAVTGASASDEPEFRGVIDDPDGYVNLRSRPSATSAIIAKVQKGERFTFQRKTLNEKTGEAEYDPWCRVKLASGKRGWMDAQRIVLLFTKDDLPGKPEKGDEIDMQARDQGIDYYETTQGAVRGDVEALQKFFRISEFADAEGGEEHEVYLRVVLNLIGDDALAAFLRRQPFSFQISVRNSIDDNVTWPFRSTGYLQRHFPKTAKIFFRRQLTDWASPDGKYAVHKVFSDEYTDIDSTVTRAELIEKATGRVLKDFSKDDEGAGRDREGRILWTDDSQRFAAYSCAAQFSGHTTVYQIAGDQVQTVALPVNDPPGRSADAELKGAKDIHTIIEPVRWSTPTTLEVGREDWFYGKYRFYHICVAIGADGKATVKDYSQEQSANEAFK